MKIKSISTTDRQFPDRLLEIPQKPSKLYYLGEIPTYSLGVAIVGTRKPTSYGRRVTTDIARAVAEKGGAVISGLAHGVDGIAHEAALATNGTTIAVLPSGLDRIYPSAHRGLAERILGANGALVSEYDPGVAPLQYRFLERNRLVSGLSDVVVVTEAGLRSGTTNTVSHALEQGRDVYVVPGPITSPMSAGCNALIAQGAQPIVSIESFIEHLFPKTSPKQASILAQNREEHAILELLTSGISDGDELQQKSGLDGSLYLQTITMLELRGAVHALGANRWSL